MRVTSTSYYNNIYGENNKMARQLFDVNKQISSGLKIQYAHDNPGVFIDTLRLDDEITTLSQIKNSSENAYKFSTQTDTTIGDIVSLFETVQVKLIAAANDTNSYESRQAIAKDLRGLKNNLLTMANSSIGGQYLFSGTATSIKPIDSNGVYQGNSEDLLSFLGAGVKQKYNITGAQLFLGEETTVNRFISTNIRQYDMDSNNENYISGNSTIRDLMGDTDTDPTNDTWQSFFYVQGTKSDGETFKTKITMNMTDTMDDLLLKISDAYGTDQVNVAINPFGTITVTDKKTGSSKLDFHMVSAVDFSGGAAADVTNIDLLQAGTNDFADVTSGTNLLYVKEYTRSGFTAPTSVPNTIQGINYDRTNFVKDGPYLKSNISQIVKADNSYALPSTKLVDVAGSATLTGTQLNLEATNILGQPVNLQINLGAASSVSGTVNGVPITAFNIYDATGAPTAADSVTYKQLLDVVNMAMTNSLPAANSAAAYETALTTSYTSGTTSLDYAGRLTFEDKTSPSTQATLSIYDNSSSDYSVTTGGALIFNANSGLTVSDPKNDFFAQFEQIIKSVEEVKPYPDGTDLVDPRNIGIQYALQTLSDLSDHVSRMQTEAGSYSQVLTMASQRTDLLIVSTKTLQSDVIDTDIAEATLRMQQLSLNYQAFLSNISKISQLSLVNYL